MATQAQQTQLLTFLVGTFDAAPTAELFTLLEGALDNGATVSQLADVVVGSEYFTGLYADTDAFVANFPAALVGPFVSAEVLTVAEGIVAQWIENGASVADVISKALVALSGVDAADETWGAAKAALDNKVTVAQYFVDNVSGASLDVAGMQAILASVTEDAATVTAAQESIDTDFAPAVPGETFTLTTGIADVVESGAGDDTITATTATMQSGDVVSDASTTDNDTMNVTLTGSASAVTTTITNVENINVELDYFTGTTNDFNATNVTGATITLDSSKLGYNGTTGVSNAGANTVVAGSNVDNLTVAGLNGGTVDAGSAADVAVDASATTKDATVIVNGDVDLVAGANTAFDELTISATASADVDLTGSAAAATLTVSGTGDVVLSGAETQTAAEIVNGLTSGSLVADIDAAAAVNAADWDVDTIRVSDDMANNTLTVATGANIEVAATQDQMAVAVGGSATTDEVTLTTGANHTTDLTFTGVETANIAVTSEVTFDNIIIGDKVVLTGSSDVTVTTTNSDEFDASAFTGELTLTHSADADIMGGTGANNITLADNTEVSYTGQGGVDTVDATALTNAASIYALSLGGGDDVVELSGALPAATLVIDGGAGTDTIQVADGTSTAGATLTLANVERVELENKTVGSDDTGANSTDLTVAGSQFTGTSIEFFTDEADDEANLVVTVNGSTTDLSGLTLTNIDSVSINGRNAKDTIIGTSGDDTITASAGAAVLTSGADTLTGGAGDDTFVIVANDSSATAVLTITDYQAAAAASDNDTINLTSTNVVGTVVSTDVTGLTAGSTVFANASGTVNYEVNDGVLTLTGLSADLALADTLAEMVSIAAEVAKDGAQNSIAFEFDGNTYILEDDGAAGPADAITNVVELTGVTGISEMGAVTAATDAIVLG